MKNNIIFKFIAILLCAATLMGAIGTIAGVVILTAGDLYNKTVDQVKQERIRSDAAQYADSLALMYAGKEMGECPESMLTNLYDTGTWFDRAYPSCGYRILDEEGTVLSSYQEEVKDRAQTFTQAVSGKYMHLVNLESEVQIQARQNREQMEEKAAAGSISTGEIPEGGVLIDRVILMDTEGRIRYEAYPEEQYRFSSMYYDETGAESYSREQPASHAGFLFVGSGGKLVYQSFLNEETTFSQSWEVMEIFCVNDGTGFQLQRADPEGLGLVSAEEGSMRFVSYSPLEVTEAAVPATTAPTETVGITVPEESVPAAQTTETTAVMETFDLGEGEEPQEASSPTVPSSASAVPTSVPEETEPLMINGKPLEDYQVNDRRYFDSQTGEWMVAEYVYLPMPELTVELYIDTTQMRDYTAYEMLAVLRQNRGYLLPAIGVCLLCFVIFAVYLCTAAGRRPGSEEVRAGGLNRLPLDLYLCGGGFLIALILVLLGEGIEIVLQRDFTVGCGFAVAAAFAVCLIFVGFCFAFVAQIKTPGGFWWRNTLCGRFIRLFMVFGVWLERFLRERFFPWLGRVIRWLWRLTVSTVIWSYRAWEKSCRWLIGKTGRIFRWIGGKLHRWLMLMPVTWQWTLAGLLWFCMTLIAGSTRNSGMTLLCMVGAFAMVLYGAHCFGVLLESTRKMGRGDLDTKVDDRLMIGSFREFAADLNDLADVAVVAAQKQLKSERMKTELITNVSHDIKTPLTSIINYVDLLQKPHSVEEERQYLEVLDRQSQRLKKLIDDLMEMSKANTGNLQVDIGRVDAVESVNQALGEFSDKLNRAMLIPVFRHDEPSVPMMADGRLVWRVMSNLLGNAVKYAMPGTRLYIDLMRLEGKVVISLKNISREELNVDAEELMERFVRGDDSRNTEGSGLGLNIAKSLMELQKGQLQLLVDGDLFKVTLIFPGA